jgi:hypothetical protein
MKQRTMIILSAMASTIGIYLIYRLYKTQKGGISEKSKANDYETTTETVYTITKPKNNDAIYDVIYLFGGMDYATPTWMLEQMPKEILLNNIVIASSYHNSFDSVDEALKRYMSRKLLKKGKSSIMGFSAGGYNVLDKYNRNFKFVGLIDPSNKSKYNNLNFGSNTYMVYNKNNWGAYPSIQGNMDVLASKIEDGGGLAESVSLQHSKIPSYFFNKFKKDLI